MKSDYTRTGARRAGDDYQDMVALEILVELLEHPTRFQEIRVEADDAGFLDDVVALRSDGSFVAKQVKFSTAPESEKDVLTWDKLLEKRGSKSGELLSSLLEKWTSSMEQLQKQGAVHEASVVSNRRAATEVQTTLSPEGLVDFGKISDSAIQDRIVQQLGDETKARSFFAEFRFFLDRPSLDDLEESVRRRFYALGGNHEGWSNLKDKLRFWIRNRHQPPPNGAITLSAVRSAGLWYQLQSLPQQFEVPKDYVLPSQEFHKAFEQDLLALQKGCIVLTASPGVGKSTYLSYLFGQLVRQNIPVIRHHYFLSPSDRTIGRLEFHRVAESLMSDLQSNFPEAFGDVQTRNPNPADLSKWVDSCGQYFAQQERTLIIILDGLDHVWREQGPGQELDRLFEHLLPVPDGIVILLGTQPVDDIQLPLSLKRAVPRDQWRELPLLNRGAVRQWVQNHDNELDLSEEQPARDFQLERLSNAFFNKSQGHPLHLRYTLKSLQEQDMPPTEANIEHLPGCSHQDIIAYYEELWHRLPEEGRAILHLFAACDFPWPKEGIIDCLVPHARNPAMINEALRQVANLMVQDPLGLRPFHSSLLVFIQGQTDHADHSQRMRQHALDWLQTNAPDYWRWGYQWLLEADLGNDESLVNGPKRQWAVETMTKGLPRQEASEILARSGWSALQHKDLSRFVEVGLLRDYFDFAYESRSEVLETLLHPLLIIEEDPYLRARLYVNIPNLAEMELALLAENEASHGNQPVVSECFNELKERLTGARMGPRRKTLDGWRSHLEPLLSVAALCDEIKPERVVDFVMKNRESIPSHDSLVIYARALWISRIVPSLRRMLRIEMSPQDRSAVFRYAVLLAFEEGLDLTQETSVTESVSDPFAAIYAALRKLADFNLDSIHFPSTELLALKEYEQYGRRGDIEEMLYTTFFCFLGNHLWQQSKRNEKWLQEVCDKSWPSGFLDRLNAIASDYARLLLSDSPPSYGWLYEQVKDFKRPSWPEDQEVYEYGVCAERAINRISLDMLILDMALGKDPKIVQDDLELAFASGYCHPQIWIDVYVDRRRKWLSQESVKWLLQEQDAQLVSSIELMSERAFKYGQAATFAALHGLKTEAQSYLHEAASNLISYGDHKDILLYGALEVVQACHKANLSEVRQWLLRLAPAIAGVRDFTDGDETRHLPRELADVLGEVAPDLLSAYYQWLCTQEEYHDALSAFHSFLRTADLSAENNQALARTAVDDESSAILLERAEKGDQGAQRALSSLTALPGKMVLNRAKPKEDPNGSKTENGYSEKSLPLPANFPPNRLTDYLATAEATYSYYREEPVKHWLEFWKSTDQGEEAFCAIEKEVKRGIEVGNYDAMFDLALSLHGKERAYPWLIRAHIKRCGWNRYFTYEEEPLRRWRIVKEHYPNRWFSFIQETMKAAYGEPWGDLTVYDRFVRLVKFCLFMGQTELAKQVSEQVITTTQELVSPLSLPSPEWVNGSGVRRQDRLAKHERQPSDVGKGKIRTVSHLQTLVGIGVTSVFGLAGLVWVFGLGFAESIVAVAIGTGVVLLFADGVLKRISK